jgi:hypothetical protein
VHFLRGARKNRGVYEVGGLPTKNVSGRGERPWTTRCCGAYREPPDFSALLRSSKELVGILGWRIAAANGNGEDDLIENLRIYSGSSGALPNGTLPPSVHNGRSSSVAVPLSVTVMPRTDRILFSIVQQ